MATALAGNGDRPGHPAIGVPGHRAQEGRPALGNRDLERDRLARLRRLRLRSLERDVVDEGPVVGEVDGVGPRAATSTVFGSKPRSKAPIVISPRTPPSPGDAEASGLASGDPIPDPAARMT